MQQRVKRNQILLNFTKYISLNHFLTFLGSGYYAIMKIPKCVLS